MFRINKRSSSWSRNAAHDRRRFSYSEIEEFFNEDDRPTEKKFSWSTYIFISTLLATILFVALSLSVPEDGGADYKLPWITFKQARKALSIVTFFAAGLWSLAASFLAVELVNRSNIGRIRIVRELTQDGALLEIFKTLKGYNGRFSEDKNVEITFENIERGSSGLLAMRTTLSVRQRMPIHQKELVFDFVTLDRNDVISDRIELSLDSQEVPHDAIAQDITDIRLNFPDREAEMFKGLTEVIIGSHPQKLIPLEVNGIPSHRRWRFDTRNYIGGGMTNISYRYEYYVEVPGFNFLAITEPTKGFSLSLNYESIKDRISVYYINLLNSRIFQHDVGDFSNKRYIHQNEWIIPNSNVTFCWYPKCSSQNSARERGGSFPANTQKSSQECAPCSDYSQLSALDVDGNCLGIAVLDIYAILGINAPRDDYSTLSDPSDAADSLLKEFDVYAIEKKSSIPGALWLFRFVARRIGIKTIKRNEIKLDDVILCERSMLQLYGLSRPELHWVVIHCEEGQRVVKDRLAERITKRYPEALIHDAETLINQEATSMVVRRRA